MHNFLKTGAKTNHVYITSYYRIPNLYILDHVDNPWFSEVFDGGENFIFQDSVQNSIRAWDNLLSKP